MTNHFLTAWDMGKGVCCILDIFPCETGYLDGVVEQSYIESTFRNYYNRCRAVSRAEWAYYYDPDKKENYVR